MQHYLHHYYKFCPGYTEFLDSGKTFKFSWSYFFFSFFVLINQKMFGEAFLVFFLYIIATYMGLTFSLNMELSPISLIHVTSNSILAMHIFISFLFLKFYQIKLDFKIFKYQYDQDILIKKVSPLFYFENKIHIFIFRFYYIIATPLITILFLTCMSFLFTFYLKFVIPAL